MTIKRILHGYKARIKNQANGRAKFLSVSVFLPKTLEGPHVLPAAAVEDEVGGGDLDGALRGDPAALVDHGHDEGVGVAVVDIAPVLGHGVEGQPDAVAVAHRARGHSHSSRRGSHIGEERLLRREMPYSP